MKALPLIRKKLSNEHIMTVVFIVLVIYQVPEWTQKPSLTLNFVIGLAFGLLLDLIPSVKRNHTIKCPVSAAITVGIIYVLYQDIPLWGSVFAIAVSILVGKQLFGGTGKNVLNPALVGVVLLSFLFPQSIELFSMNSVVMLAMVLSLPFVLIRPYCSLSLMFGMVISMWLTKALALESFISSGVIFWGTMIVTDPVTISYRPLSGAIGGFVVGCIVVLFGGEDSLRMMALLILCLNVVYTFTDRLSLSNNGERRHVKPCFRTRISNPYESVINAPFSNNGDSSECADLDQSIALTAKEIIKKIEDAGIVGLGGAGYPTHLKIKSFIQSSLSSDLNSDLSSDLSYITNQKTLIVNAVECDPGLVHDQWLLNKQAKKIQSGIHLLNTFLSFDQVIIATKQDIKYDFENGIQVKKVPNYYPVGAEKELIKVLLNKDLAPESVPTQNGVLVLNVQTIFSINEAICSKKKTDSKYITIANLLKKEARVVKVTLGDRVSDVIQVFDHQEGSIFVGGGIMQARKAEENELVGPSMNFIAISHTPRYKNAYCSKCGLCALKCPVGIEVFKIARLVDEGKVAESVKHEPASCISCGICSYVCLAGINLAGKVRIARDYDKQLSN